MTDNNSTPQTPDLTPADWEQELTWEQVRDGTVKCVPHYRWVAWDGRTVRAERYPMEQEVHTALRLARVAHQQLRYYRSDGAWSDVAASPVVWHDVPESHAAVPGIEGDMLTGFAVGALTWVFEGNLRAAWRAACQYADVCVSIPRQVVRPIIDGKIRPELVVVLNPETDVFECRDPLATAPGYTVSPADDEEPTAIPTENIRWDAYRYHHFIGKHDHVQLIPESLTETRDLWPDGSTSDTGPDLQNPTEVTTLSATFESPFDQDLYDRLMGYYFPRGNEPDPVDPPEDPPSWAEAWKNAVKPATTVTPADTRVDKFPQVLVTNGDTPMIIVQCNENRSDYIEAASVMAIRWEDHGDGTVTVTVETESRDVQPNFRCFTLPTRLLERFVDALDHAVVWGTK